MGTPAFAVPTLQALLAHGENVVGVVTQPDRPKGRGRKLTPPPVKEVALAAGIPILQPTKIKTQEFQDQLKRLEPELIVVTAYGRILPGSVLFLPPLGAINIHGSILPKYRGAAPIQWALINGEKGTGVTIMQMDEGLDTGDILLPGSIPIDPQDTASTLAEKLAVLGSKLIIEALDRLKENKLPPLKQDESLATLAPPLTKEDGRISWEKSAFAISCLIRGLDPWPLAFTTMDKQWFKLFLPTVVAGQVTEPPGTLCRADKNGLQIATGKDYLQIKEVQLQGNRRMDVASFLNGHPLTPGIHFE